MNDLNMHHTEGAAVERISEGGWRLTIPAGRPGKYRWAQLDDYTYRKRSEFLWRRPVRIRLRARLSAAEIPGTWGFGFWNDPFSFGLGLQGMARRFPALPDAVWFFHGSSPNYLSFSDQHPAIGMLASVFSSTRMPGIIKAGGLFLAPLLAFRFSARWLRRLLSKFVKEDAAQLSINPIDWHVYSIIWNEQKVVFTVDQEMVFETGTSPHARLGLVIWVDNQFASFRPDGKFSSGTLENQQKTWMEIEGFRIEPGAA